MNKKLWLIFNSSIALCATTILVACSPKIPEDHSDTRIDVYENPENFKYSSTLSNVSYIKYSDELQNNVETDGFVKINWENKIEITSKNVMFWEHVYFQLVLEREENPIIYDPVINNQNINFLNLTPGTWQLELIIDKDHNEEMKDNGGSIYYLFHWQLPNKPPEDTSVYKLAEFIITGNDIHE